MAKSVSLIEGSNITKVLRYDNGSGTYTDLGLGGSQDLFDDSFEAGDILYFHYGAFYSFPIAGVRFDIDTAISATDYELVWEYYDFNDGWTAFDWIVDDTNSFSNTGENWVYWRIKRNIYWTVINSLKQLWVRCRVVSSDTPTEGGKQSSVNIRYRSAQISISGGTSGDPITMADIVAESSVVDAGLVEEVVDGYKTYIVYGNISQNSSSYFKETNSTIIFNPGYWYGGYFTFGEDSLRQGKNGCNLNITACKNDANIRWACVELNIYNSKVISVLGFFVNYSMNINGYGTTFGSTFFGGGIINFTDCNINSWTTYTASSGYNWTTDGGNYQYIESYQGSEGLLFRDASINLVYFRWQTKVILFDCDYNTLGYWGNPGSYSDANAYIHYSLKITTLDSSGDAIQGATVIIKDQNDNNPTYWSGNTATGSIQTLSSGLTTDSNGETTKQDLLFFHRLVEYTPTAVVTNTTYSPFIVTISKSGYQTKTIVLDIDSKTEQIVTLEKAVDVVLAKGEIAINVDPSNSQSDVFI